MASCGSFLRFLVQVFPEFFQPSLIHEQFKSNIHSLQIVLIRILVTTYRRTVSVSESSQDTKQFPISPSKHDAAVLTLLLSTVYLFPKKQSQRFPVHPCSHRALQRWYFYTCQ